MFRQVAVRIDIPLSLQGIECTSHTRLRWPARCRCHCRSAENRRGTVSFPAYRISRIALDNSFRRRNKRLPKRAIRPRCRKPAAICQRNVPPQTRIPPGKRLIHTSAQYTRLDHAIVHQRHTLAALPRRIAIAPSYKRYIDR